MRRLGPVQRLVLDLLAISPRSVATIVYDGFGIPESSARSALDSLARRGYVERSFHHNEMQYHLTPAGRLVADSDDADR